MKIIKTIQAKKGFSLIELMIVLVIIGLLISFALPNFQKTNQKADLIAAKTALGITHLKVSRCYFNQLERYQDQAGKVKEQCNYDYQKIDQDSNLKKFLIAEEYWVNPQNSNQASYKIDIKIKNRDGSIGNISNDKKTFEVTATMRNNENDSDCYELVIDEDGNKSSSSDSSDSSTTEICWN